MKIFFDKFSALIGLILTLPVLALTALVIRLSSKGPAIFSQERVGFDGKNFICYKLRTMALGTKQVGTHEVSASSVTGVGKILRATKLDELPQLWNVLKGEMSLVGPRPCLPMQTELIDERTQRGVLKVLPGITGLSQVEGIDMSNPVRLAEMDAQYLEKRSFFYDIAIIFWTLAGKGRGDRVDES